MSGWISIEDRLPEYGIKVITFHPSARYNIGMRLYCNKFIGLQDEIHPTYWAPLPEPPNE